MISSSRKHLASKPPTTISAASLAVAMRALRYQHKFVEVMGLRPTSARIDEEKRPPVAVLITNVLVVYCHSALAKPTAAAWLAINHGLHPDRVEIHVVVLVVCVNALTPIVRAVNESQRHDELQPLSDRWTADRAVKAGVFDTALYTPMRALAVLFVFGSRCPFGFASFDDDVSSFLSE